MGGGTKSKATARTVYDRSTGMPIPKGKVIERKFKFGNRAGRRSISKVRFPAEANVRIKKKTEQSAINYFAKNYRNADHEYGYAIDRDGYVHAIREGSKYYVGISGSKGQMIIHNHPSGNPGFSSADLQAFALGEVNGVMTVAKGGQMIIRKKGGHFKKDAFQNAINKVTLTGSSLEQATASWLKANQKKFGYTFEYKKRK